MPDMRCPHCGGLNPADARWCGQCLAKFTAPPPESPPGPPPPPEPPPGDELGRTFAVSGGSVTWRCSRCSTENEISATMCSACGLPFSDTLRGPAAATGPAYPVGIGERLERAVRMIATCWRVLLLDPELLLMPLLALVLTGSVGWLAANWWLDYFWQNTVYSSMVVRMWLMTGFSVFAYVVGTLTSAAVVAGAMDRLKGGDPTLDRALGAVGRRILPLLGWSLIGAAVNIMFHIAQETLGRGRIARAVVRIGEVAWANVTFFVIPVILFEGATPFKSLTRSARLFRRQWAETLVGTLGIGFAMAIIALPIVLIALSVAPDNLQLALAIGLGGLVPLVIAGATLTGIYNAALYHYAATGEALAPFSKGDMQGTFYQPSGFGLGRGRTTPGGIF